MTYQFEKIFCNCGFSLWNDSLRECNTWNSTLEMNPKDRPLLLRLISSEITKADNALELDGKVTELSFKNSISHSLSEAGFSLSSMANLLELYCEKTSNFIAKTKQKVRQI